MLRYAMLSTLDVILCVEVSKKAKGTPLLCCVLLVVPSDGIDFIPEDINKWCAGVLALSSEEQGLSFGMVDL